MSFPNETAYLPSLRIFVDIIEDTISTWDECHIWAITDWAVEIVFYMSIFFIVLYLYVIIQIAYHRLFKRLFKGPFYNSVILLSIGDIGTLITCARVTIPACSLRNIPARYLAFESVCVFCVDFIYGVNLIIALIRLNAVVNINSHHLKELTDKVMNILLFVQLFWSLSMGVLYFNGMIKRIWFIGTAYYGEFLFPFSFFRTPFNLTELALTFIAYFLAFIQLRRVSQQNAKYEIQMTTSSTLLGQQWRLLVLALLIFLCELLFIYSSDWLGSVWGIGDDIFNAHVSYFGRPIATGITPILYLIFSSEIRQACFYFWKKKIQPTTITVLSQS